ncbi:hypothetical protein JNK62_02315 [bacterium]|nr:hypothetical protein [bacterium]
MHGTATLSRSEAHAYDLRETIREAGGVETFLRQGFLQIRYDPSVLAEHTPAIINDVRRMIDGEDRDAFAADIFGRDEVGWQHDSGLYRRSEREQKWFFHCFKETADRMIARAAPVDRYTDLFHAMEDLNRRSLGIATLVGTLLDEYHAANGIQVPYSLEQSFIGGACVTRTLRYLERAVGKPDATAHIDRAGITVHWWGSRQGLVVIDESGTRHRILETEYDTICIFPGKKFGAITKYAYGHGTLHGVVDTARESGATDDRFAVVSFVHPTLTKEEAAQVLAHEQTCAEIEQKYAL